MSLMPGLLAAYVLVPVLSATGAALVALLLSRPAFGFVSRDTRTHAFGHEVYEFKSATRRRVFKLLVLGSLGVFLVVSLFLSDQYLVTIR